MIVQNSTQVQATPPERSDSEKAGLNYDAFLKLMLAQLKSQDPLNPMDQTQSLAQLATFTNVEQAIKLNQKLDALLSRTSAADAAALVGRTVQSLDGTLTGAVRAVEIGPSGTIAVLSSGARLPLANGLRVTAA